ncbi:MAG: hypothetical protein HQK53_07895 [Oligoflexia bacterium]|nr:hypothetical protein [Oligoflexia bacterium]
MSTIKIGMLQISSQIYPEENIKKILSYSDEIKKSGAQALFLPEYFYSYSSNSKCPPPYLVQKNDPSYYQLQELAKSLNVYLLGGSAATRDNDGGMFDNLPFLDEEDNLSIGPSLYNRIHNFTPQGEALPTYDKMHLFVCDLNGDDHQTTNDQNGQYDESKYFRAGKRPLVLNLKTSPLNVCIGFGICFDLRFPEYFRELARQGAELLSISSAFTVPTGKAHWHTLLRARAIENQCYVVAAAQCGRCGSSGSSDNYRYTYGHSLLVDPWGEVIIDAGDDEGLHVAEVDLSLVHAVRKKMKVF